jgi:serine/threonine protein kinase
MHMPSAQCDLWALSVILYEMLTLTHPFTDFSAAALLDPSRRTLRPVSSFRADIPPQIDAIFARSFHPDASQRFASAQDLSDALDALPVGSHHS